MNAARFVFLVSVAGALVTIYLRDIPGVLFMLLVSAAYWREAFGHD